jgi:hypothetical protein
MDNQTTNKPDDNLNKYLVTEGIDPNAIPKVQVNEDLNLLSVAEQRATFQTDISHGVKNPELSRAMQALRLSNPFKGY